MSHVAWNRLEVGAVYLYLGYKNENVVEKEKWYVQYNNNRAKELHPQDVVVFLGLFRYDNYEALDIITVNGRGTMLMTHHKTPPVFSTL